MMCNDLIKRSVAIRALNREKSDWNNDYNVPIDNCIERLNKVKSADRPQGEWIYDVEAESKGYYWANCSQCGLQIDVHENRGYYNYCPNCGARMK